MTFGERLREARKAAGLSQGELAGDHCSLSYVSHIESGRRAPTLEMARYFEQRLGLDAGELGAELAASRNERRRAHDADLLAEYLRADRLWRGGAFGDALELTTETLKAPLTQGREDLRWLLTRLLADIQFDLGQYQDSIESYEALSALPLTSASNALGARVAISLTKIGRVERDAKLAKKSASEALRLTANCPDPSLRAEALLGAISVGLSADASTEELRNIAPTIRDNTSAGLTAWTLGTLAYRDKDVVEGDRQHAVADEALSPFADLRNWARLPRATADSRLSVGNTDGVQALIDEARRRLEVLNTPDELAMLAITEANLAKETGHSDEALAPITRLLEDEELPDGTRGDMEMAASEIYESLGDRGQARAAALTAARYYTAAEMLDLAKAAWARVDPLY